MRSASSATPAIFWRAKPDLFQKGGGAPPQSHMIWKLRKKFILICFLSFICVFAILFSAICVINSLQTNADVDELTDMIAKGNGKFPEFQPGPHDGGQKPPDKREPITQETRFSTRYFTVRVNADGEILATDMTSVASVTEATASDYAREVLEKDRTRGWLDHYRYLRTADGDGELLIFVDGSMQRSASGNFLYLSFFVFAGGSLIVLLLIVVISRFAVKPAAQAYEKQKQFITDASHELKTPLTLILTNLDIAESELGKNEWLEDMRSKGEQMNALVRQLVTLARLDEATDVAEKSSFSLSDATSESVAFFRALAAKKGLSLEEKVPEALDYTGDEAAIRQLLSILIDNAVKYCDPDGKITVSLSGKRHPVLSVENTYREVGSLELDRLFDRFYRADKARTGGDGFGIGLSIAKGITEKHHGTLTAQNVEGHSIRFVVRL